MNTIPAILRPLMLVIISLATLVATPSVFSQSRMTTDPRMVVIPWRGASEIQSDLDNAAEAKLLAQDRRERAETRLREIANNLETRKQTLKDIDRRKDEAKKNKRESEEISLKIEEKANKQAVDLLNRLKDLRKAEVEEAKAEIERAEVDIEVLQMETELLSKRDEYDSLAATSTGDLTLTTAQQVLQNLEVRLLELQRKRADATQKLASKQKDIVTRRMKLHDAQAKLGMPRA